MAQGSGGGEAPRRQIGPTPPPPSALFPVPAAIGPALPEDFSKRPSKRSAKGPVPTGKPREASPKALADPASKRAKTAEAVPSRTLRSTLSGRWLVKVKNPAVAFVYTLEHHSDNSVTGFGVLLQKGTGEEGPKVSGQLQGYVLTWTEETGGRFRATLHADGQSFSGTAHISETASFTFDAVRLEDEGQKSTKAKAEPHISFRDSSAGEILHCPRALLLVALPNLSSLLRALPGQGTERQKADSVPEVELEQLLQGGPVELAAKGSLLLLLRAVAAGRPEEAITSASAVHVLALAEYLGCRAATMGVLLAAVEAQATELPAMLTAVLDAAREPGQVPGSLELVLKRGLLIRSAASIEALAKDAGAEKWRALCGRAVLQCLLHLAADDPDALRLSPAAAAALTLGLAPREVHAAVPSRLRFGPKGTSLVLDLRKRGIGPEGAAKLELPSLGLEDVDLDLSRCGIRAVGAASLRFPAGLLRLRLILQKCDIGPEGVKALALPFTLVKLELDLSHCLIGPTGAAALQLPRTLVDLDLGLLRCAIGDRGAKALVLPEGIQKLRLDLARCALGAEGLRGSSGGLRLPSRLTHLSLDLTMCQVGIDALKALVQSLPAIMESLELELTGCNLGPGASATLHEVANKRMPGLKVLKFSCD